MTTNITTRLPWIKYDPTEWQARFSSISDSEYGLLQRIVAILWRTPGIRIPKDDLIIQLRINPNTEVGRERATNLETLFAAKDIRIDDEGRVFMPELEVAFGDAVERSQKAKKAAAARYDKAPASAHQSRPSDNDPEDF